jgi:hypothetical protein
VPLHCDDEPIRPRILKGLDQTVGGPCAGNQITSYSLNSLMVVTVYYGFIPCGERRQPAFLQESNTM